MPERDVGSVDAGDRCAAGGARVEVSGLSLVWTTPHTLRWSWTPTPSSPATAALDLTEYRIYVGPDRAAVESSMSPNFGPAENPELGGFLLRAAGTDAVVATTTDGLNPSLTYYARITALDRNGALSCSNVAIGRTQGVGLGQVTVFDGTHAPPALFPTEATVGADGICFTAPASAFEFVGTDHQALPLMALTSGPLANAYFDAELTIHAPATGDARDAWSTAQMSTGAAGSATFYTIEPLAWRAGPSHYELPLRAFTRSGGMSPTADMLMMMGLNSFRMGSGFIAGTRVCLGATYIRY